MNAAPSIWWMVRQELARRWRSPPERLTQLLFLSAALLFVFAIAIGSRDGHPDLRGIGQLAFVTGVLISGFVPVLSNASWMFADQQHERAVHRHAWLAKHGVALDLDGTARTRGPDVPAVPAPDFGIIVSPSSVALGAACFGFAAAMYSANLFAPGVRRSIVPTLDWIWLAAVTFLMLATIHGAGRATRRVRAWSNERAAKTSEQRLALARVELDALQNRMSPALLFTALDAIGALSETDPPRAERLVERLAAFLRLSLQRNARPFTSLEDERRFVTAFEAVAREQPGRTVHVAWQLDPDTLTLRVPTNGLFHLVEWLGEPAAGGGRTSISITSALEAGGARLRIIVEGEGAVNCGAGTMPPAIAALAERLAEGPVGRAGLTLETTPSGVRVRLQLPALRHVDVDRPMEVAQ